MPADPNRQFRPTVESLSDRCLPSALGAAHHHPKHRYFQVLVLHPHVIVRHHGHAPLCKFHAMHIQLPPLATGPNHMPPVLFHPGTTVVAQNPSQDTATNFDQPPFTGF
jgi:hypothetical protein